MEEFEPSSYSWNLKWKISRQVRCLESGMEEFEPSSTLGIGNGGVRATTLGIGNGGVRAKFEPWNGEWMSSSQVPTLGI